MLIGIDTGFFYALESGHKKAEMLWSAGGLITSVVVIFELHRKFLKEKPHHPKSIFNEGLGDLQKSVDVIPLSIEIAMSAAHLASGTGIHASDAMILASLLSAGCREIYTTDKHLQAFRKKGIEIITLEMEE